MLHFNNLSLKLNDLSSVNNINRNENNNKTHEVRDCVEYVEFIEINEVEAIVDEIASGNIKALEKIDAMGIEYTLTKSKNGYSLSFQFENNNYFITYVNSDVEIALPKEEVEKPKDNTIVNKDGSKEILEKDENGNIIKSEKYDKDGNLIQTTEFSYHKDSCQLSKTETITYADGKKVINDYDKQDRVVRQEVFNVNGDLDQYSTFAYHKEDCLLGKTETRNYANGNKEIIDYNKQDKIIRQDAYDNEGHKTISTSYEYRDDNSYEVSKAIYSYCESCNEEYVNTIITEEYDSQDRIIREKAYNKDRDLEYNNENEYLDNGNVKFITKDAQDKILSTHEYNNDKSWQLTTEFLEDGTVDRTIEVQEDFENESKVTIYKDGNEKITAQIDENKNGKIESYYYDNGNTERIYSDANNKVQNSIMLNSDGKVIETIIYDENELVNNIIQIKYNEDETMAFTSINSNGDVTAKWLTDADEKMLEFSEFDEYKKMWKTTKYNYQEDGSVFQKTTYENGEVTNITKKDSEGKIKATVNYENGEITDKTKYTYIDEDSYAALITDKNGLPIEVKTNYPEQIKELETKETDLLAKREELVKKILEIRNNKDLSQYTLLDGTVSISSDIISGEKVTIQTKEEMELYHELELLELKDLMQLKSKINGLKICNDGYEALSNIAAKIQVIKDDACNCECSQKKFNKFANDYKKTYGIYNKAVKAYEHFANLLEKVEFPQPPQAEDFCCDKSYAKAYKKYTIEMKRAEKEATRLEKSLQKVYKKLEDLKEKLTKIDDNLMAL